MTGKANLFEFWNKSEWSHVPPNNSRSIITKLSQSGGYLVPAAIHK